MASNINTNTEGDVQISTTDQVYLTEDGDGQIIFVVHPDEQFNNSDGSQVVYIETPDTVVGNTDEAVEVIQSEESVTVSSEVPQTGPKETSADTDSKSSEKAEVQDTDEPNSATKIDEVNVSTIEKPLETSEKENYSSPVEPERSVYDKPKDDSESSSKDVETEETVKLAPPTVTEPNVPKVDDDVTVEKNDDTNKAVENTERRPVLETPKKDVVSTSGVSTSKNVPSPILRDVSPTKPTNLKPMPESGPFILHEDDFEMEDGDELLLKQENKRPSVHTNGKIQGNIFENINKKINGSMKKSDEEDVTATNNGDDDKKIAATKPPDGEADKSETVEDNASHRRSQRSKRPPEKFTDIVDAPSPVKRSKPGVETRDHLSYSPLKLNERESRPKCGKSPCKMYIRYQHTPAYSPTSIYRCDTCHFTTTRLDNIVIHHKTHLREREFDADYDVSSDVSSSPKFKQNDVIPSTDEQVSTDATRQEDMESDDDLPALSDFLAPDTIEKDDIVIITWRKISWPALVSKVFPKKKKVDVMVIDGPFTRAWMKLPMKRVNVISETCNLQKLKDQSKDEHYASQLESAVRTAQHYFNQKSLGLVQTAAEFFKFVDQRNDEADNDLLDQSMDCSASETCTDDASSRAESRCSSVGDVNLETDECSGSVKKSREMRRKEFDKVIRHIVDGKIDKFLVKIYNGKVKCERDELFRSKLSSARHRLKQMCSFGPLEIQEHQEKLIEHLLHLMKNGCHPDEFFDAFGYVFEVWIPEAIIKAIQKVQKVDESKARKIFSKGPVLTEEEMQLAQKEFANNSMTDEEYAAQKKRLDESLKLFTASL